MCHHSVDQVLLRIICFRYREEDMLNLTSYITWKAVVQ